MSSFTLQIVEVNQIDLFKVTAYLQEVPFKYLHLPVPPIISILPTPAFISSVFLSNIATIYYYTGQQIHKLGLNLQHY